MGSGLSEPVRAGLRLCTARVIFRFAMEPMRVSGAKLRVAPVNESIRIHRRCRHFEHDHLVGLGAELDDLLR